MLTLALATWSVQDPSLSHATDAPVRNLLGRPGAIFADLSIQLFGLASIVLVLPIAIWGWRLLTHRAVRPVLAARAILDRGSGARLGLRLLPAAHRRLAAAGRHGRRDRRRHAESFRCCCSAAISAPPAGSCCRRSSASLALAAFVMVRGLLAAPEAAISPRTFIARPRNSRRKRSAPRSRSAGCTHLLLSAKARVSMFIRRRLGDDEIDVASAPRPERRAARAEPRMRRRRAGGGRRGLRRRGRRGRAAPAPRKARAAATAEAAQVKRRLRAAAAQHPGRAQGQRQIEPEHRGDRGARRIARKRAGGFRRQGRDHQCAPRPGGDALRTRARARHQVVARDRPCRRHRALDERGVGPRRRGTGPQRHRHRIAERVPREGLFPRDRCPRANTTTRPRSCRSVSARPSAANRWWSISRACRIC